MMVDAQPIPAEVTGAQAQQLDFSTRKAEVEGQLRQLRDANRLAMHCCEDDMTNPSFVVHSYPKQTHKLLSIPSREIPQRLTDNTMPLISMTLIPSLATGKLVEPYTNSQVAPTYLFSMDQEQPHPPKVVTVHPGLQASGGDNYHKGVYLFICAQALPSLRQYYQRYEMHEWRQKLAEDTQGKLSAGQLDLLGHYYQNKNCTTASQQVCNDDVVQKCNEIIVAASHDHLKAIMVPHRDHGDEKWRFALNNLTASLAGLQHLRNGIDVPVVHYQMIEPDAHSRVQASMGDFEYIGQGRQELSRVLLESLQELEGYNIRDKLYLDFRTSLTKHVDIDDIRSAVKAECGIDMFEPLAEQTEAVQKIKAAASMDAAVHRRM